jgi:integrase
MKRMAKIELPYVKAYADRHGRKRHYYRRRGFATVTLPGDPGSSAFMAAYADAHKADAKPDGLRRLQPRSINALIVEYYKSGSFRALRDSTARAYRGNLDRFRARHGDKGVASIQTHHLEAIFHGMADRPGAAQTLRKRLRQVFGLAVRLGWRADNPVSETSRIAHKTEGFIPWSEADIAKYEDRWPTGSRERLALALLLYTGQRRSDVVSMGRQHIADGRISVRQAKTGARLRIRLHAKLKAEIDAAPMGLTFLLTAQGAPFTAAGFGNWFRERCDLAGVNARSAHGLRKAAGRRLAEAGCTEKEIAAVLGHSTLTEVARYTRDADQAGLSDSAIEKTEARTGGV